MSLEREALREHLKEKKRQSRALSRRRRLRLAIMGGLFLVILVGGWFHPFFGYFVPLCMVAAIMIGLFRGRQWCDWLCPRGSFLEYDLGAVRSIGKRARDNRRRPQMAAWFSSLPWRFLWMGILMTMVTMQLILRWPDPYKIGKFFWILLAVTTVVGLIAALAHPRGWCAFCPIGSMANWVGRGRYPLFIADTCNECSGAYRCTLICPLQLRPWQHKPAEGRAMATMGGDCLKCSLCVVECPTDSLKLAA